MARLRSFGVLQREGVDEQLQGVAPHRRVGCRQRPDAPILMITFDSFNCRTARVMLRHLVKSAQHGSRTKHASSQTRCQAARLKMMGSYTRSSMASTPGAAFSPCRPASTRRMLAAIAGVAARTAPSTKPCTMTWDLCSVPTHLIITAVTPSLSCVMCR